MTSSARISTFLTYFSPIFPANIFSICSLFTTNNVVLWYNKITRLISCRYEYDMEYYITIIICHGLCINTIIQTYNRYVWNISRIIWHGNNHYSTDAQTLSKLTIGQDSAVYISSIWHNKLKIDIIRTQEYLIMRVYTTRKRCVW